MELTPFQLHQILKLCDMNVNWNKSKVPNIISSYESIIFCQSCTIYFPFNLQIYTNQVLYICVCVCVCVCIVFVSVKFEIGWDRM